MSMFKFTDLDYNNIVAQEDEMRKNMYKPGNEDKDYNSKPYYNLEKIDYTDNSKFPGRPVILPINGMKRKINIYNNKEIIYKSYKDTCTHIHQDKIIKSLDKYKDNIFIAGGYAFSQIINCYSGDIDIFIHSCDIDKYDKILKYLIKKFVDFEKNKYRQIQIMRTNHAITVKSDKKYQIVLRLYKSPSEILHGFDVDSCCVGMDYTGIYLTKRALYAIFNGYNTVNFDRMSPTYECRLVKYAKKGVAIKIPDFDKKKIDIERFLIGHIDRKKLQGLDIILYSYLNKKYKYGYQDLKLSQTSDYDQNGGGYHIQIRSFLEYNKLNYLIIPDKKKNMSVSPLSNEIIVKDEELQDVMDYIRNKYGAVILSTTKVKKALKHIRKDNNIESIKSREEEKSNLTEPEQMQPYLDYLINSPKEKIYMILYSMDKKNIKDLDKVIDSILNIPDIVYSTLANVKPWNIPQNYIVKKTNPGEQMTNTFHTKIYNDRTEWYKGYLYNL